MFDSFCQLGHYQLNFYGMPLFLLSFASFFFGVFTLIRERCSLVALSLFLLTLMISNWLFCFALLYWSKNDGLALGWANAGYLTIPLIAPSAYWFICISLDLQKKRAKTILAGFILGILFVFTQIKFNLLFNHVSSNFWGFYPRFGSFASIVFSVFFWLYMGLGLSELISEYKTTTAKTTKYYRIRLLLLGSALAFLALIDSLPNFGLEVYPFGYAAVAIIILILLSLSKKVEIFDIKPNHSSYHLLNAMNDAMILCDDEGVIRLANNRARQIIGGDIPELVGKSIQDVILKNVENGKDVLDEITQNKSLHDYEAHCLGKEGNVIPVSLSYAPILDPDNEKMFGWAIMAKNITERKEMEKKLTRSETFDQLTGLYNRKKFEEELHNHLEIAKQTKIHGALLLIDLDRFKEINDSFGHSAGDKILVGIASILRNNFRKVDVVSRLGSDEFAVITPNVKLDDIKFIVSKLLSVIGRSRVQIEDHEISMSVSIGVALFPLHADTADTLLAYADYALYKSKRESRNSYSVYSSSKNWSSPFKMQVTWATRIRHALQHNRFVLLAQPIYNAKTNKNSHYELLLRMYGDDDKLISPDSFIHVAAHYGLIRDINYWVLEQVFSLAKQYPNASFTCNLSGGIFSDDKLLSVLDDRLANAGVNPDHITIEITENVIMSDIKNAMRCLTIFKKRGLKFALDDFGTGLSSFAYLKGLPIDFLKIDGSFVKNLPTSDLDKDFVHAMVQIAKRLGVKTVAEYVENQEIVDILNSVGVDYFQGYHFSKPIDIAEAIAKHPIPPEGES